MSVSIGRRHKEPPAQSPLTVHRLANAPAAPVVADEPLERDALLGSRVHVSGPASPTGWHGAAAPQGLARGPVAPGTQDLIHVVGLHGGAGTSTVTALLGERAADAGTTVPVGEHLVVLLVARTHAAGLAAIRTAGQAFTAGQLQDVRLLGLVLVDDGPRISRDHQRAIKPLLGVLPMTWRFGWHEPLRMTSTPAGTALPARVRRSMTEIRDRGISFLEPTTGPITKEAQQ
ncbi:DUF6668 family protein [Rudaeicoccus suwonensis]|uniref:Uncharacterized protein n=1 Tax=Rudaeicoccus suwonensis TaxID=657409 RepID=A0A561DVH5_9MICO|nr:DUF6668 family protein [Rudaeicoccus suwonensis]TWE07368.1 hypothetical protein BKA23_3381 [Rudaeicoccus suwonensis]